LLFRKKGEKKDLSNKKTSHIHTWIGAHNKGLYRAVHRHFGGQWPKPKKGL